MSDYHIYQIYTPDNRIVFSSTIKRKAEGYLKRHPDHAARTISTKSKKYMVDSLQTRKEMSR